MKFLSTIGALFAASATATKQCERHVELMLLQDASTSYYTLSDSMAASMNSLIERLNERLGSAVASVAIFSDKPVPFRGNGRGRGYIGELDVCYYNGATFPLGSDPVELKKGYDAVWDKECEGGDFPENPLEAMIYAAQDPKVQWSPADQVYTDDKKRIVKVLVTVTDDHPHYAGDAKAGIFAWNPLTGPSDGYPHFFDTSFASLGAIYNTGDNTKKYARLVELHGADSLTAAESLEYQSLLELLGPAVFDQPIPHPGTFDIYNDCDKYEYPTLKVVGEVLNRENILPIMLLSGQNINNNGKRLCKQRGFDSVTTADEWLECLLNVYRSDFKEAQLDRFMVEPYGDNADALVDQIVDLVDRLSHDVSCPEDTTTTLEDVTTTDGDVTTTDGDATTDGDVSTDDVTTTGGDATTNGDGTTDGDATTTGGDDDATTTGNGTSGASGETGYTEDESTNDESTTDHSHVIPPVVPVAPGSNTAVIAGAAGGSAAGLAALGGVLYKKFGAGLLGGNSTPDLSAVEQVEVPETPVEREAFEEVTMDMFQ